ncbi:Major facilitator superfamily domain-containing protein 6-like 5 [Homarus americanus]|uniref:Major facilitator superfamily domain-containing protein 6-like 5 n=1 Tax=Homarus americanus TaxID=6706 RepID=A0A8J5MWA5_HOMAM|nr:Major facilitator superfamily domain-containing protein 6-like 5 [Homarus americanus]
MPPLVSLTECIVQEVVDNGEVLAMRRCKRCPPSTSTLGCLIPFLTIHMRFIGLNKQEITWINSVLPLTSLLGPPLVGMMADRLGHYRPITIFCMLFAAILHTALLFVPSCEVSPPVEAPLTLRCNPAGAALVVDPCGNPCPQPITLEFNRTFEPKLGKGEGDDVMCYYPQQDFITDTNQYTGLTCQATPNCEVICNATEVVNGTHFLQRPQCSKVKGNPKLTLWLYFGVRGLAEMFSAILVSLLEAVALTMVHQHKGDYGREKMFGLLAVGVFSPISGYLIDNQFGTFGGYSYAPVFYVFNGLMLVTAVVTVALPIEVQVERMSLLKNITQLIHTTELSILLLLMTLLGIFWGYLKTFVYLYLEDLHASKLLLGLTLSFGIVPSLPFLYRSTAVVKYCGHHYLIMLAFLGYCIRFAGLSYIINPWWALLLESLELFTLNLMNVSAATLAYKLSPKTFVATAQALVWVSHFNIGRCIGTFVGGHLRTKYGDVPVFQGAAIVSAACAAVYLGIHHLVKYLKARQNVQPTPRSSRENGNIPNGHYTPLQVADEKF